MSITASLATKPVKKKILVDFFCTVRPFGFWKPVRKESALTGSELREKSERPGLSVLNVVLGMLAITGFYLFPMYLVGHWYGKSILWLGVGLGAAIILKFTWYNKLFNLNNS